MIGSRRMHIDARGVAKELRECRLKAAMSQRTLALALGVSLRTIGRWEAGTGRLHRIWLHRIRELAQTKPEVATHA